MSSIKVTDFGIAQYLGNDGFDDKLASTTCGTPGYIAPEILNEELYNEKCDSFSIGVVTYILLCGHLPFFHEDVFELFELVKRCEYSFNDPKWKNVSV